MKQKWLLTTGTALALAAALAGCGNTPAADQPQSSQPASLISMEQAQTAALDAADIDAADAEVSSATLDEVAGVTCYKVEFTSGDHTYAYSINAESGEVLEASYRDKNAAPADSTQTDTTTASGATTTPAQTTPSTNTSTGAVTEAKAQEIALAHAGIKAADATITKSKLDYDDGRQIYEIEWYANGAKYDYEIAVATGEIVNSGYEAKTVVGTGSSATVSEATAKQTALARVSGATDKDIYEWKLDYDDGRPEYEGKIIYGGTEYEFTIDAASGNVTEWEAETLNR
ncbi:PepSY domain-containing protein [Flavonifractor plautii]|mgnify:CR=1 FL=1|nr:PepSY domain-containing protein [Flavonifractor plautii]MCQ5309026.1 PepSY domain-containing protein [Flavonifractor plautii]